jgi:hypothetical protein
MLVCALPIPYHVCYPRSLLAGAFIVGGMLAYLFMESDGSGAEHKVRYPNDQLWWYNLY